jgi:hypothetical protein
MENLWAELKWIVFQAKYCLGTGNLFESKICRDFRPWAIGVAAVLTVIALVVLWHWLAKRLRAWLWRRQQTRVADKETMDRIRWTGDDVKR